MSVKLVLGWNYLDREGRIMEVDKQLMKVACMVCCPMCDEAKCVGRYNCPEVKGWIDRKREEYERENRE